MQLYFVKLNGKDTEGRHQRDTQLLGNFHENDPGININAKQLARTWGTTMEIETVTVEIFKAVITTLTGRFNLVLSDSAWLVMKM